MDTIRFTLIAVGLFALTFVGIAWANKGFPVMAMKVEPMKPNAGIPTFEDSVKKGIRKDWDNSKTNQSDGNKERDELRLTLLQASIGYKLSPCDATIKKNLVMAVTNYTKAWQAKFHCKAGIDGCPSNEDDRIDFAAAAFKTAADVRVHDALREAYEQGGVGPADFPRSVRDDIYLFSRMPFGGPQAACILALQAQKQR
jgi:hypothetical protein